MSIARDSLHLKDHKKTAIFTLHEHLFKWVPRLPTMDQKQPRFDDSASFWELFGPGIADFFHPNIIMDEISIHSYSPKSYQHSAKWSAVAKNARVSWHSYDVHILGYPRNLPWKRSENQQGPLSGPTGVFERWICEKMAPHNAEKSLLLPRPTHCMPHICHAKIRTISQFVNQRQIVLQKR